MVQLNSLAYHSLIAAGIVVVFVMLTRVVQALLKLLGRKVFEKTETVLDDKILDVLLRNVRPAMLVAGLFIAVREIHKGATADETTVLQLLEYTNALLYVFGTVVLIKIVVGIMQEVIQWYLDRISNDGAPNLKKTLGPLTAKLVNILIGLVGVIIILDHFGINIGSLLVSLGVGSLAVALAAQDTLANMIAGFVILVDRPFRVGDRIEVPTNVAGDVLAIGLRSTRVLNFDNNVIIIPNAELVKSKIVNHAYPFNQSRVTLRFDLAYGTDVDRVRAMLLDLLCSHPDILPEPEPKLYVTNISEAAVQVTVVARAKDFSVQYNAETSLRERAYALFLKEGISMPVPRHIVRMADGEAVATN